MTFELPPVAVDLVSRVSGLSAIAGDVTAISGDARFMAWVGKSDYWLWLVLDDHKNFRVLINAEQAPETPVFYAAIGYCEHHNIVLEMKGDDYDAD